MAKVYCVVIDYDPDPDMSWLEQDMYDPASPSYEPTYLTEEDMKAGRNPIDPEWYRDPANHVALQMTAYAEPTDDDRGEPQVLDSLGGIDFLRDSDEWRTGAFYRVSQIRNAPYLQELAREMGLED